MPPLLPVIIGGRIVQMLAPKAIEMVRSGAAKLLSPGPRTVGSQGAGAQSSGPFYGGFTTNVPPPAMRPGLLGMGLAAGAGADAVFRPLTIPASRPQIRPMDSTLFGEDVGPRPSPMIASDSTLAGYDMPPAARAAISTARSVMPQSPPMPPPRPAEVTPVASGPSARDLWERYNETGSAADFARADAATPRLPRADGGGLGADPMAGLMPPDMATMPVDAPLPMPADAAPPPSMDGPKAPAGGGAGGRDAAINKALDIIHRLITTQRV